MQEIEVQTPKFQVLMRIILGTNTDRQYPDNTRDRCYSRGQAKPANLVSRQGRYLEPRFFQILVQIC